MKASFQIILLEKKICSTEIVLNKVFEMQIYFFNFGAGHFLKSDFYKS
jgi:hypothetical protein